MRIVANKLLSLAEIEPVTKRYSLGTSWVVIVLRKFIEI